MAAISTIKDGMAFAFSPPAVVELGQANGFDFMLQDRSGLGHDKLMEARNQLLGMAMKNPKLMAVRPNGQDDSPQFKLDIDDVRAGALGVSHTSINEGSFSCLGHLLREYTSSKNVLVKRLLALG